MKPKEAFARAALAVSLAMPMAIQSDSSRNIPEQVQDDRRQQLIDQLYTDFGITVFDSPELISSTEIFRDFRRDHGTISQHTPPVGGVDRQVATAFINYTAVDLGIPLNDIQIKNRLPFVPIDQVEDHKRVVLPFRETDLQLFAATLEAMPKYFVDLYRSNVQANTIELYTVDLQLPKAKDPFVIMPSIKYVRDDDTAGWCACFRQQGPGHPSIIIGWEKLQNKNRGGPARALLHELTHLITIQRLGEHGVDSLTKEAFASIGIQTNGKFSQPAAPELTELLMASGEAFITYDRKGKKVNHFPSLVGYGATTSDEFLAIAVQEYIFGSDNFMIQYSRSLGESRSQALYDFVRREFFDGYEFADGEVMNKISE